MTLHFTKIDANWHAVNTAVCYGTWKWAEDWLDLHAENAALRQALEQTLPLLDLPWLKRSYKYGQGWQRRQAKAQTVVDVIRAVLTERPS